MKVSLAELLVARVTSAIEDPVERAVVTRDVVVCDLGVDYPSEGVMGESTDRTRECPECHGIVSPESIGCDCRKVGPVWTWFTEIETEPGVVLHSTRGGRGVVGRLTEQTKAKGART